MGLWSALITRPAVTWSIRKHLLILVLVAVLPAMGLMLLTGLEVRDRAVEEARRNALRLVQAMAENQERVINDARILLVTLARVSEAQNLAQPALDELLAQLLAQNPAYATLAVSSAEGHILASAIPVDPFEVNDRKYFQDALRSKSFTVGSYAVSRTTKKPVLHFAQPVLSPQGQIKAVLIASLDLSYFGQAFAESNLPPGSVLSLTDHKGTRLFRHPGQNLYAGQQDLPEMVERMSLHQQEGTFLTQGVDKVHRLYGYKRLHLREIPSTYLLIRVGIPVEDALRGAKAVTMRNVLLQGSAALLSILAAWLVTQFVIMPRFNRLAEAARRLGAGELGARTGMAEVEGELGRLASAFDMMAQALEGREAERKQAEQALRISEENYRGLFENAVMGIYQATPDGIFVSANPAVSRLFGYASPEELLEEVVDIGQQLYVDPEDRRRYLETLKHDGRLEMYEVRMRRKDGELIWVSMNSRGVCSPHGELVLIEGQLHDITKRKRAEEELVRLNAELEDRVAKRTAQLEAANRELTGALDDLRRTQHHLVQSEKMAALGGLVAGVAHEVNTPVGVGVTAASHLEKKTQEFLRKFEAGDMRRSDLESFLGTAKETSHMILANLERASDLIRSFKKVAVDQTSEQRRRFRLKEYLAEVLLSLRPKLKKTKVMVEVRCPEKLEVESYPGVFSQIITNLVVNSLTHAFEPDQKGRIVFDLRTENGYLHLDYTDDGKGMDREILGKIFEPFFTTSRAKGGTGLGLHILYNLVTQTLGGTVRCESAPGQGATFHITLPLGKES